MRELQLDLVARVDAGPAGDDQRLQQPFGARLGSAADKA